MPIANRNTRKKNYLIDMATKSAQVYRKRSSSVWKVPLSGTKLTHSQFLQLLYGFAHDATVTETAEQSGLSTRSVGKYFTRLRRALPQLVSSYNWSEVPSSREITDYFELRKARMPGWREKDKELHLEETKARLITMNIGNYWLFGMLLYAIHDDPRIFSR